MVKKTASKSRGRPAYVPTEEDRVTVDALAVAGYAQAKIAAYLRIDPKTLRLHYRNELDTSAMKAMSEGVTSLMAAVREGKGWAVCFLLKCKGSDLGWIERSELTGAKGKDLVPQTKVTIQGNDADL